MKILLITIYVVLTHQLWSQDIIGQYSDGEQFLNLDSDSLVRFRLYIDREDNLYTLRTGSGKWTLKNDFLIIDIKNTKQPYFKVDDKPSDTIEIYDFKGESVPFAKAVFYNEGDSVGWRLAELNGIIDLKPIQADSIQVKAADSTPIGFKLDKGKNYKVYVEHFSFINHGQIVFKLVHTDKQDLTLKHIQYSTKDYKVERKFLRNLWLQSLFTTGSINYDEFKRKN